MSQMYKPKYLNHNETKFEAQERFNRRVGIYSAMALFSLYILTYVIGGGCSTPKPETHENFQGRLERIVK